MKKIKFNTEDLTFSKELTKRVHAYFSDNGLDKKGDWRLYSKTVILFVALGCALYGVIISPHILVLLGLYALIGFIIAGIGFNVMHDGAHGSYSNNDNLNELIAFIGGDLMGGSTFLWKLKHNEMHHHHTNIEGFDDDIAKYPLFRITPYQKLLSHHKHQHVYAIPLYLFTTFNWILWDDYFKVVHSKKILYKDIKMKRKDIGIFWIGKVLNLFLLIGIPWLCGVALWEIALGFLVMHACLGLTLALVFQMAHVVQGLEFPNPENEEMDSWMKHQLATTTNFAMGNKFISWYVGGLNYQVEHHLFRKISHVHYPAISKIVQQVCKEWNVPYHAFPTFGKALSSHFAYLRRMGQAA